MSALFPDPHPGFLLGTKEEILIVGVDIASEKVLCTDAKGHPFITALASVEWDFNLVYVDEGDEESDVGVEYEGGFPPPR